MRRLPWIVAAVAVCATFLWAAQPKKDTPSAAKTRKRLKEKLTVNYKDTRLRDVATDISKQLDDKVVIKLDNDGGVSNNLAITYRADDKPLEIILDEMFAKNQLGYVIISNPRDRRDGFIIIKKGKQRGYETGEGSTKAADKAVKDGTKPDPDKPVKPKDKADADKPARDSTKPKDKASTDKPKKDKARDAGKTSKNKPARDGDEDPDKSEKIASAKLSLAKMLQKDKLIKKAKERYHDIIERFPKTKAAEEAAELLKKLEK